MRRVRTQSMLILAAFVTACGQKAGTEKSSDPSTSGSATGGVAETHGPGGDEHIGETLQPKLTIDPSVFRGGTTVTPHGEFAMGPKLTLRVCGRDPSDPERVKATGPQRFVVRAVALDPQGNEKPIPKNENNFSTVNQDGENTWAKRDFPPLLISLDAGDRIRLILDYERDIVVEQGTICYLKSQPTRLVARDYRRSCAKDSPRCEYKEVN